jgi:Asp-tRNA(Asn)/Glu-tRNA(Gln) amidotransferase A subunit family amidase
LRRAGIEVVTRKSEPKADAVEAAIAEARPVSMRINAWEWRWPLNTYSRRDASKLSRAARDRLKDAEAMTLDEYRTLIAERARIRAVYARLKDIGDACVTLAAPGAAPVGLETTGDPIFAVPFSLLGVPAVSLPVLRDEGLPLGLQLTGFEHEDAALFGHAASVLALFDAARD